MNPHCFGKETIIVSALCFIVSMFGKPESSSAQIRKAYACAATDGGIIRYGHNCILFDFKCEYQQRILIRDAFYVYWKAPPGSCEHENNKCRKEERNGCCTYTDKSSMVSFSPDHKYSIYKLCTWSEKCTARRTPEYNGSSSSLLKYECQPERKTVKLCESISKTGEEGGPVNILFIGNKQTINNYPVQCTCTVRTANSGRYTISAPDLRLQSPEGNCSTGATLSGLQSNDITCTSSFTNMSKIQRSSHSDIRVSFKSNPEFIWIDAKAEDGNDSIIVECSAPEPHFSPTTRTVSQSTTDPPAVSLSPSFTTTRTVSFETSSTTPYFTSSIANELLSASHSSSVSSISMTQSVPTTPTTSPKFPTSITISLSTSTAYFITQATSDYLISPSSHQPIASSISMTPLATITTTTTDTNEIDTMAVHGIESNDFPIAAVIIPVVVLVGVGVGIIAWLKWRHRRQSETKKPGECRSQDSRNWPLHAIQNKAYDNTDHLLVNGPVKTSDNYIVLDQENTYTYIDHVDAQAGLENNKDLDPSANVHGKNFSSSSKSKASSFTKGNRKIGTKLSVENDYTGTYDTTNASYSYAVLESQPSNKVTDKNGLPKIEHETENVENHNYFILEPQNACAVEHKKGGNTLEDSTDDSPEPQNYFVLEPQNSVNADPTYPQTNKTLQVDATDNEVAQSHDYFVLEPQKPLAETSIQPKATTTRMPGFIETAKVKHQKYLESEPQDTYSSIDPDDVIIQTLPENEYNVINMKGKSTITRDPNYGTLETVDQIGNDIEDSGDYSHIGKSQNKKMDMNEYSHT